MRHARLATATAMLLAVSGMGAGLGLAGSAGASTSTPAAVHHSVHQRSTYFITVPAKHSWTYTSIWVNAGQQVKITATGTIHVGSGVSAGPAGKPFTSSQCGYHTYNTSYGFLAPGLNCWSLLFSVDGYPAFQTGSAITFVSPTSGYLQLGVNDDYFRDNSGAFTAKVVL